MDSGDSSSQPPSVGLPDADAAPPPSVEGVEIAGTLLTADSPLLPLVQAIDGLLSSGLTPASTDSATGVFKVLEREAQRLYAAQVQVMAKAQDAGLHRTDGHRSAHAHVRHVCRLSNAEAGGRAKVARMFEALGDIKAAFWAGEIGLAQVQLLARVFANRRVRGAMAMRQDRFISQAKTLHFAMFEVRVREWERLIDEDGPEPANERTHRNRSAKIVQDSIDLGWELVGKFAAMQGAAMHDIFLHYIDAEWQADWEKAVAQHGDSACLADMPRTDAQRRADAMWQMFQDAAANPNGAVPAGFTHNVVWSAETYEEMVRRLEGHAPTPLDPDTYKCETIDGVPLEPTEAAVGSLLGAVRRLVVGADGVALDMGARRFYTGALRDAINIAAGSSCIWPGCHVASSKCEADHLHEYAKGGKTTAANGAPLCKHHNRWKQTGYTVARDPAGAWHVTRPDGTPVPT